MPAHLKILIDFEKIKDPYCGLGQFCAHLKKYFDQHNARFSHPLHYWVPNKLQKLITKLPLMFPKSEIFHAVHQDSPYIPKSSKTKYILTIHDLNALYEHTQFGTGDFYKKKIQKKIDRANAITFISEFTKTEVEKYFNLNNKKLAVIYNGISLEATTEKPDFIPNRPFLFSIGTVLPKKNFHVLIDFLKLVPDFTIILAGTTFHSYAQEMQKRIEREGLLDRFHLVGTINGPQKLWYYQHASAFLFPSLLEGFGLPVVEAMSIGLPLFLSNKTSLPEIGGNDAYYFENFEATHMCEVFTAGMKDFSPEKKSRLIERSKLFDWKKAADSYIKLYESI